MSSRFGFSLDRMACVLIDNTSLHIHVRAAGAGGTAMICGCGSWDNYIIIDTAS